MTRVVVYSASLLAFASASALTITSLFLPTWLTFSSPLPLPTPSHITYTYGLHRACTTLSGTTTCRHFPAPDDCSGSSDGYFCVLWRTTGWLMTLAAVLELATLVAYAVVLIGGKQKRAVGWKILAVMLVVVAAAQCAGMGIVAYLFDNDDRFFIGWRLGGSWVLCTVSWVVTLLSAAGLVLSAFIFPSEDGYELIPSERQYR